MSQVSKVFLLAGAYPTEYGGYAMSPLARTYRGEHLMGKARMQARVSGDFAQVGSCQLPHLRCHAVLLHQWLPGEVNLLPNAIMCIIGASLDH